MNGTMQNPRKFAFLLAAAVMAVTTNGAAAAPRVLASLIQPPGGLDCGRAADEAQVVFDFQQPRSDVKQISVFVNGHGLKESEVTQEWPRLTVKRGLRQGRNTVEAVATGADGKAVSHKLTVLVGEGPKAGEKDVAVVDCGNRTVARGDDDDDDRAWGEDIDDVEEDIDEDVAYVEEEVDYLYDYEPRYVYRPYPVFSFIVYQPAYYYPYPYYYSHYYHRPYRHGHYDRGGGYSRGYGWPRDGRSGYERTYRSGDGRSSYRPNRPPTHDNRPPTRDGGSRGAQLSPPSRAERSPPARSEPQRTDRGRGWR